MKNINILFNVILLPLDYIVIAVAGILAYWLRVSPWLAHIRPVLFQVSLPFKNYLFIVLIFSAISVVVMSFLGLYNVKAAAHCWSRDFLKIIIGLSVVLASISLYSFFSQSVFESRFLVLACLALSMIFLTVERILMSWVKEFLIEKYSIGISNVLLIGSDGFSKKISEFYESNPEVGYKIIKKISSPNLEEIKNMALKTGIDIIILADPNFDKDLIVDIINFTEDAHITFRFVPNIFQVLTVNATVDVINDVPLVELKRTALDTWGGVAKRTFDVAASSIGLIVVSPVIALLALIIKWDSDGPVFVKLKRISQGKEFYMYKFRSMIKDADKMKEKLMAYNERTDGPLFKMTNDPRVTRVGKFIRKTRLDEIPQLMNVLKGNISLVGPRPHEPGEVKQYNRRHKKILAIKSGITGVAQISGSSDLPFEEEIKLDIYYVENWSFWLDIIILMKTVFKVLGGDKSAV